MPSDLIKALNAIDKARPGYVLARQMYDGDVCEIFANDHIKRVLQASANHYRVNVARKPVTAITNRLKINAISVPDNDAAAAVLTDQVWNANDLAIEIPGWIAKVAAYGDAYLLSWPSSDTMTEEGQSAEVGLFVHSPENARLFYDPETGRTKLFYAYHWDDDQGHMRVNLLYSDRLERFRTLEPREKCVGTWSDVMFEPFAGDEGDNVRTVDGHLVNPYGEVPVEHGRTARPYGRPVHKDAYGPQNSITKLTATQMEVTDQYGWPYRYQLSKAGTNGANLADWNKDNREAPSPHGKQGTVHRDSRTRSVPGTMNKLKDTDAVGQLEASPASNFIDSVSMYVRLLGVVTDTPIDGLNATGAPESGESRRAKLDGLLSRAEMLQLELEGALRRAFTFCLGVLGQKGVVPVIEWKPLEKISDLDGWTAVNEQIKAGVPVRAALIESGYLPTQLDEWDKSLDSRMDVLERLVTVTAAAGIELDTLAPLFAEFVAEVQAMMADAPAQ